MANLVLIRVVRSDGKNYTIGAGEWKIPSDGLKGIDFPSFSLFSEKNAIGDGALLSGKRVNDRDVQVTARSVNPKHNLANRTEAISFFNPKYSFKLYVTYLGVTRWLDAELQGFSCPSENIYRPMQMVVKFYCKDGFMKSVDDFGQDIASIEPGFGFPYIETHLDEDPVIPAYADLYAFNQEVTIDNDGDTMTYPRVTISFNGTTVNPKIYKDDYFVRILDTFDEGDVVEIDFENCTIKKNGQNWIHYIDRASTFTDMGLGIGSSTFGFEADDGDSHMHVFLYFNKLFLGL